VPAAEDDRTALGATRPRGGAGVELRLGGARPDEEEAAMTLPISPATASTLAGALHAVLVAGEGPTSEQRAVARAFGTHLLGVDPTGTQPAPDLGAVAAALPDTRDRRRCIQMAIMTELCRHPRDPAQLAAVQDLADALGLDGPELESIRRLARESADAATHDFVRTYHEYRTALSERRLLDDTGASSTDPVLWQQLDALADLPTGTLGWAYLEFHRRNGFELPHPGTPAPAYYVSHDMGHVIAGYEPTGPGEIALGAFKLAASPTDANWMASMVNVLIHEVGLFKHGSTEQFVPFGGAPYPGPGEQFGALSLPGASDLVAEAFDRGAACTGDINAADHLALAELPIREVRARFGVRPLRHPMIADDDPSSWP
jgi:hypothetical protein